VFRLLAISDPPSHAPFESGNLPVTHDAGAAQSTLVLRRTAKSRADAGPYWGTTPVRAPSPGDGTGTGDSQNGASEAYELLVQFSVQDLTQLNQQWEEKKKRTLDLPLYGRNIMSFPSSCVGRPCVPVLVSVGEHASKQVMGM